MRASNRGAHRLGVGSSLGREEGTFEDEQRPYGQFNKHRVQGWIPER